MTRREKIIISAYTGTNLAGDFAEIQQYIEEKLGRPIMTHELALAKTWDEIRDAVRQDFIEICETETPEE